jgi:ABC-type sulfate transport system permease subunit
VLPAGQPAKGFALRREARTTVFWIVVGYGFVIVVVMKILVFFMPLRFGLVRFFEWIAHDFIPCIKYTMQANKLSPE